MRSRITITISEDLLKKVDLTIDNHSVRNRSQAIETLLRQVTSPSLKTAVILAGGGTSKFKGQEIPKSLIPLKQKPLLLQILDKLGAASFTKVVVCTGPKTDKQVRKALSDYSSNLDIRVSSETKPLGTGGAIKHAQKLIGNQPFLLLHGDIATDINFGEFADFYFNESSLAAVAVKPRPGKVSYGQIYMQGNRVVDFKNSQEKMPISLVNTGIYIFNPKIFDRLPSKQVFNLEETLFQDLVKTEEISGYIFQGIWFDVTDPKDWQEANTRWK